MLRANPPPTDRGPPVPFAPRSPLSRSLFAGLYAGLLAGLLAVLAVLAGSAPTASAETAGTAPAGSHGNRMTVAAGQRLGVPLAAPTPVPTTGTRTAAERSVAQRLTGRLASDPALGDDVTGLVVDAATGRIIWSRGADSARIPASTTKVATALTALQVLGPDTRLTTTVRRGSRADQVVLVGAGDPSLSSKQLDSLSDAAARDLRNRGLRRATVVVDDSLFPAPSSAPGWRSSYVPGQVRAVRALVVDERHSDDTSIDAGEVFARKLSARGIPVDTVVRGVAPRGAAVVGRSPGQPVSAIVQRMLMRSDNDHAEALFRLVALARAAQATWSASAGAGHEVLGQLGLPLRNVVLHDGSGLSRANRITPRSLVAMIALSESPRHARFAPVREGGLPVAGVSGTLSPSLGRFSTEPATCAKGKLTGKTGNLTGAQSLTGVARGTDGRERYYAFIVSGQPASLVTKQAVDRLAATATGCA